MAKFAVAFTGAAAGAGVFIITATASLLLVAQDAGAQTRERYASSAEIAVKPTPAPSSVSQPECGGKITIDENSANIAATAGGVIGGIIGESHEGFLLGAGVARIIAQENPAFKRANYAECGVTCAAVPAFVSRKYTFDVYVRDKGQKWKKTAVGGWDKGLGWSRWDEDYDDTKIFKTPEGKVVRLVCKRFRNWSHTTTREAKFNVNYTQPSQLYILSRGSRPLRHDFRGEHVCVAGDLGRRLIEAFPNSKLRIASIPYSESFLAVKTGSCGAYIWETSDAYPPERLVTFVQSGMSQNSMTEQDGYLAYWYP